MQINVMKSIMLAASAMLMYTSASCSNSDDSDGVKPVNPTPKPEMYAWEAERNGLLDYTDMVLLYGGGHQRLEPRFYWDADRLPSYITYTDQKGDETWFFDAFLFLEFADYGTGSNNVTYAPGYKNPSTGSYLKSAAKEDWQRLLDYFFHPDHNLHVLDNCLGQAAQRLGEPPYKRRVVLSMPEPIQHLMFNDASSATDYWGALDDRTLDFSSDYDRLEACKWYIDLARKMFDEGDFKNIELAGFYMISEHSGNNATILKSIAKHLNKYNHTFNWIPYFAAEGYQHWKMFGFNYAYLQPNYFFNQSIPEARIGVTCQMAINNGMDLEVEFDDNVLARYGKADRLRAYISGFRQYNIDKEHRLAYYQGGNTVYSLHTSTNPDDKALFYEFGDFVTKRAYRSTAVK